MTRLSTSTSTWNLARTKWVHPQWFTQGCDFKWAAEFKAKKNSNTERTATGNPLYIRIMSDPPRASSWTSTCTSTSTPSRTGQCECPMLRSMPLTVANFLLLRPGATATTTPFICSGRDYSLRQVGFFLNTSSFRFVPRHLAAILCQFPVHCVWVSLAPAQTHKQNQIQAVTGTEAGKQQPEWSFAAPPSLSLYLFLCNSRHLAECQV